MFILITVLIILSILIFKKPSITGQVILGKETIFSENLNLQYNESGTYNWTLRNPGIIRSIKATGSVSSNGTARVYIEKNGQRQLVFDSTKPLFDVDIRVLSEYKKILQGGEILIQNILFNLRGFGAGYVKVKYSIKDSKGNLIASEEESVFIETQAKFVRKLVMPAEIKPGTYLAFVEASTNATIVGSGSDTFEVVTELEIPKYKRLKYYLTGIAVLIVILIIFIFGVYILDMLKKKKEIAKLKEKIPVEEIVNTEEELRSLEEAYNSGYISEESYKKEKKRLEEKLGFSKK